MDRDSSILLDKSPHTVRCAKCTILISGEFISNKSKTEMYLCNHCDNSLVQFDKYGVPFNAVKTTKKQLASRPKYQ